MILAKNTLAAIDSAIEADQGAKFRTYLGQVLPHIGDAYRGVDEGFRSHLGASMIGQTCARKIWYGFRWMRQASFSGRILRLFNRGHLEEGRFIASLLTIGVQIYQQDENGKQFRISECGGHFGGSGDGVAVGIPDLPPETACLLEFKTHNDKSFQKLVKAGVREAKPEHYVQMNVYMRKMGLAVAMYGACNKNDDAYHFEIVHLDVATADQYLDRGRQIVFLPKAPQKISSTPGWFECKWCDYCKICHLNEKPAVNCRTCRWSTPAQDGNWYCRQPTHPCGEPAETLLTKEQQLAGCEFYGVLE